MTQSESTMQAPPMLPPGATIGILGAGQLGRMLALAAAPLGLRCHIYADAAGPAMDVAAAYTIAAYDDQAALAGFAQAVDVVTYEFENIPLPTVTLLAEQVPVRPGAKALECAQDRLNEKTLARELGAATADFAAVDTLADLERAIAAIGGPAVLKTRRFGYDGKGQVKLRHPSEAAAAWAAIGGQPAILEGFIDFRCEVSVIAARALDGTVRAFALTENEHRDHILHRSVAPASLAAALGDEATNIAAAIAASLDYVGTFAIEFFVCERDGKDTLLVNEMAPRVHNSGHWTIEGAITSQFEQHIRAVAGWPLGDTTLLAAGAEMINLIGDDSHRWPALAAEVGVALHLYGKSEPRPGRKMGHATRLIR